MAEYFSTLSSLNARISSLRLKGFIDFDGDDNADEASLTSAYKYARGVIRGRLEGRYGTTEIDTWDSDTVPELVGTISDDLCLYQILKSNPKLAEVNRTIRDDAMQLLDDIAGFKLSLYGTDGITTNEFVTERVPSDFDPERELDDMTVRVTWSNADNRDLDGY